MDKIQKNDYGSLCTEMYEILHEKAPEKELAFYLSYAEKGQRVLEPMCGSGRFLIPFSEKGFDISGMDRSGEMLERCRQKLPGAKLVQADLETYRPQEKFDYIFVTSGSMSLFTDFSTCERALQQIRSLLAPGGKFVFSAETMAASCPDDEEETISAQVKTSKGFDLILKTKNAYDEKSGTQFSPGNYELYDKGRLIRREFMDFQTHLYRLGEMEQLLTRVGFQEIKVYSDFDKEIARDDQSEMFLYECTL